MDKQFTRYIGELTRDQLRQFFNNTLSNASSLRDEAKLIFDSNMYSRAYFLLRICTEEIAKAYIISLCPLMNKIDWSIFWNVIRDHKFKTGFMYFVDNGLILNEQAEKLLEELDEILPEHEEHKMACLYNDVFTYDSKLLLMKPTNYIDRQLVESLLSQNNRRLHLITTNIDSIFPA